MADIYIGLVNKETDLRYVIRARAMPTLMDLRDLSDGGFRKQECDWGLLAMGPALERLAVLLLADVTDKVVCVDVAFKYARDVLFYMASGQLWMLTRPDIEAWLQKNLPVS